jgi:hypothetical protein
MREVISAHSFLSSPPLLHMGESERGGVGKADTPFLAFPHVKQWGKG